MKRSVKTNLFLLGTLLALIVAGCSSGNSSPSSTPASTNQAAAGSASPAKKDPSEITIGIAEFHTTVASANTLYDKTIRKRAEELGVKTIIYDATGDAAKQIQQMETLIQQQVDVLIAWPSNAETIIPQIKKAKEKGIPVVVTNSPMDDQFMEEYVDAFTGPNSELMGKLAAEMLAEALNGKGKVVHIAGFPGIRVSDDRDRGFEEEIKKYPDIEIIDKQHANFSRQKAQSLMENMLTKHPQIDGVFSFNDDMAIGAINALKDAGRLDQTTVVTGLLYDIGHDAIKAGEIYGSVLQNPAEDAILAIETALKLAQGEPVEKITYLSTGTVTKANIDQTPKPGI